MPTSSRTITALAVLALASVAALVTRPSGLWKQPGRSLGALPHGVWFSPHTAPVGETFTVRLQGTEAQWEGVYDNSTDRIIYHFGLPEKPELTLMSRLAEAFEGAFVDVGANVGAHSVFMASRVEHVHAVEPWPPVLERFRRVLALNPGLTNISVHAVGYGASDGVLPFFPPPEGLDSIGTFDASFLPGDRPEPIPLPIVRADDHLASVGAGRVGIVKCDIEGFERYAFEGMRQVLLRDRPAVVFEVNNTEGGFQTRRQLEETFPPNYVFRQIEIDPDWMLDFAVVGWFYGPDATGRYRLAELEVGGPVRNALGVPAEREELLAKL